MSRAGTDLLKAALKSGVTHRLVADSFYGATRTAVDVPVTQWELRWDLNAEIKSFGQVTVAYSGDVAESYSPREFTDLLAPYGQELNLLLEVSAGDFSETVQLGHYRIVSVPDAIDDHMNVLGRNMTVGSRVTLQLQDRLVGVKRRGFRFEESPPSLASCWDEIGRLTGLQLIRSVPAARFPTMLAYCPTRVGSTAISGAAESLNCGRPRVPYVLTAIAISYAVQVMSRAPDS